MSFALSFQSTKEDIFRSSTKSDKAPKYDSIEYGVEGVSQISNFFFPMTL